MAAVCFEHVSKRFVLQHERDRSFQELTVNLFRRLRRRRRREDFWALRDVSFSVEPGETLGIIGENGSGKSTTLKLVSRILEPTSGRIEVNGRVSALLELGAGFHPDLTGRENIYLNASLLGFSRREIRQKTESIIAFAELERFIDIPVRHYSSGMFMRLGFAIAIHVDPDILLTDEVLAVGDESFQRKCLEKIGELQRCGKTILFVSHDMNAIRNLCNRVLWLHQGKVQAIGEAERVVDAYLLFIHEREAEFLEERQRRLQEAAPEAAGPSPEKEALQPSPNRWGSGEISFREVHFLDAEGNDCFLHRSGAPAVIEMAYTVARPRPDPVFGIAIYRQDGLWVYGTNTAIDGLALEMLQGTGIVRFHMPALHLLEGQYWLDVAVHARDGTPYDYWRHCWNFAVYSPVADQGVYRPEHRWEWGKE